MGRGSCWGPDFPPGGYCHLGRQELGLSGTGTVESAVRKPESELLTDVGVRGNWKEDPDIKELILEISSSGGCWLLPRKGMLVLRIQV